MQSTDPGIWVQSRQFSGRIVRVTNARIFHEPVYNYTRDFAYIWEEDHLPISCMAEENLTVPEQRFPIKRLDLRPRISTRLTDCWVELNVRFVCRDHNTRGLKDRMSREIIDNLDAARIGIASGTYEVVRLPTLHVEFTRSGLDSRGLTLHRAGCTFDLLRMIEEAKCALP